MKPTKHNIKITLQKGLVLFTKGEYTPPEPKGSPSEFCIEAVSIEEGTIMDLLDWTDGIISKECNLLREAMNRNSFYLNDSIWYYLQELCIKEIENE